MSSSPHKTEKNPILLDTNALLWYLNGDNRMSLQAAQEIYEKIIDQSILVSISSFWEILCFSDKKMSFFKEGVSRQFLISKIKEVFKPKIINIDEKVLFSAYEITSFHSDPADRFILATALTNKATLYTSDELILRWHQKNSDRLKLRATSAL
jgi:PIN domain nuclease of toxin-antitoxin system